MVSFRFSLTPPALMTPVLARPGLFALIFDRVLFTRIGGLVDRRKFPLAGRRRAIKHLDRINDSDGIDMLVEFDVTEVGHFFARAQAYHIALEPFPGIGKHECLRADAKAPNSATPRQVVSTQARDFTRALDDQRFTLEVLLLPYFDVAFSSD